MRWLLPLLALLAGCAPELECDQVESPDRAWCVDRAVTADERRDGLQGTRPLLPGEGLLLVFPLTGEVCVSNEGVAFPIDVVYIGEDATVLRVARQVPADSPGPGCEPDVRWVLEVPTQDAAPVQEGDHLSGL